MFDDPLTEIPDRSLVDEVADRIRTAIIAGRLKPGARLSTGALAEQLNVSRSPVRTALEILERQNLVKSLPNRGSYVWQPTADDIQEILTMRVVLECAATELALGELTEEDFSQLQSLMDQHRRAVEAGEALQAIAADKRFHQYMFLKAGNVRLLKNWEDLMSQWEVLLHWYYNIFTVEVLRDAVQDHTAILEGIRQRDLAKVCSMHRKTNAKVSGRLEAVTQDMTTGRSGPGVERRESSSVTDIGSLLASQPSKERAGAAQTR